jgi:hypothetical protein
VRMRGTFGWSRASMSHIAVDGGCGSQLSEHLGRTTRSTKQTMYMTPTTQRPYERTPRRDFYGNATQRNSEWDGKRSTGKGEGGWGERERGAVGELVTEGPQAARRSTNDGAQLHNARGLIASTTARTTRSHADRLTDSRRRWARDPRRWRREITRVRWRAR